MKSMKIITSPGDTQRLSNGLPIPGIGYGTYLAPDDTSGTRSILDALEAGYRLIDTASVYGNEKTVGRAVRESSIPREEIFITSKVWNTDQGYESTLSAFDASLNRLETDYLDLYLIHWPIPAGYEKDYKELNRETWKAMERLYKEGQARAIGVSNFLPRHLEALMEQADTIPMVNQLEINPRYHQTEAVAFCREHGILVESWGPWPAEASWRNPSCAASRTSIKIRSPDMPPLGTPARHRAPPQIRACGQNQSQPGHFRLLPGRRRHGPY